VDRAAGRLLPDADLADRIRAALGRISEAGHWPWWDGRTLVAMDALRTALADPARWRLTSLPAEPRPAGGS
jgi:hypothetical protein